MGLLEKIIAVGVTATAGIVATKALKNKQSSSENPPLGFRFVNPTRYHNDYIGEDSVNIAKELYSVGFENIELQPLKKLGILSTKKYGKISAISINGNSSFSKKDGFSPFSYIIISYLDFKDGVDRGVYDSVNYIDPENWNTQKNKQANAPENTDFTEPLEFEYKTTSHSTAYTEKKFCPFCGTQIQNNQARFCALCGENIESI